MKDQPWLQVELKMLPGAEPWLMVRHRGKSFRLPFMKSAGDVYRGALEGWDMKNEKGRWSSGWMTITTERWLELEQHHQELMNLRQAERRR